MKNIKINNWLKKCVVAMGVFILGGVCINAQYHVIDTWVYNGVGYFTLRANDCNNVATIQCVEPNDDLPPIGHNYNRIGTAYYPDDDDYQTGAGFVIEPCARPISTCEVSSSGDLCRDGSVTLTANVMGFNCDFSYLWNDGSQEQTITVTQAGWYSYTATDCYGITCSGEITVLDEKPNAGNLTFTSGGISKTICNETDLIYVSLNGETGTNQAWVITDENLNILDTPAESPFNFNNVPTGTYLIWNISYEDLQGAVIGQNAGGLTGCFDLSNSISVEKLAVEGGNLTFSDGSAMQNICIDDEADPLFVNLTGESGGNQAWVITDSALNILDFPVGPPFDFNSSGVGTCLIWSINYEYLVGAQIGLNAGDLFGCFDLSNSIEVVREVCATATAGLGDYTWFDSNQDGIQDPDEEPLSGITVQLFLSTDSDKTTPIQSTITNANGYYEFLDLEPDLDYIVNFGLIEDYVFTESFNNASDGDVNNSDANPVTGSTDVIDLDPGEFDATIDAGYNLSNPVPAIIDLKLQGAIDPNNPNLMIDDLRINDEIPLMEPYSMHPNFNHNGGEIIDAGILSRTGESAIVDWILAEVRDPTDPTVIVASRAGLLQRDGDLVDVDGESPVEFDVPVGEYFISLSHRNHLSIMTAEPVLLNDITPLTLDFTNPDTPTYGENAQINHNGINAMWAGSINSDKRIVLQGVANDVNEIFFDILGSTQNVVNQLNFILEQYSTSDLNMDGQVIYQGVNNDPNVIFFNILSHPGNVSSSPNYIIKEQMP